MCGVRTNLRMPDVMSIGLGGGSVVTATGTSAALCGGDLHQRGPQPQEEEEVVAATELGAAVVAVAEEAIGAAAAGGEVAVTPQGAEAEEGAGAAAAGWGVTVGPQSVGNRLLEKCLHGGGGTYVATDLVVDLGRMVWFGPACDPDVGLPPSLGTRDRRLPLARAGWEVGPAPQGQRGGGLR